MKELKEVQDLEKCYKQTDGVTDDASTREACASKKALCQSDDMRFMQVIRFHSIESTNFSFFVPLSSDKIIEVV